QADAAQIVIMQDRRGAQQRFRDAVIVVRESRLKPDPIRTPMALERRYDVASSVLQRAFHARVAGTGFAQAHETERNDGARAQRRPLASVSQPAIGQRTRPAAELLVRCITLGFTHGPE